MAGYMDDARQLKIWGWPASGEIDIMEHIKDLDVAVQTVHTTGTEQKTYPLVIQGPNSSRVNGIYGE